MNAWALHSRNLIFSALALILGACTYQKNKASQQTCEADSARRAIAQETVVWEGPSGIGALLTQRCASCHGSSGAGGVSTADFATAKDFATRILAAVQRRRAQPSGMPPAGPLSDAEISRIQTWVEWGTPRTEADIPLNCTVPSKPTQVAARALGPDQVTVSWTHSGGGVTGFVVEYRRGEQNFARVVADRETRSQVVAQLEPDSSYEFRAMAFNSLGASEPSASVRVQTPPRPALPPAAPTNLRAVAVSPQRIQLNWNDNAADETGYRIERRTDASAFAVVATTATNVTQFEDSGLAPTTRYFYRVRAFNAAGESPYSNVADAMTPASPQPPTAPTNLTAAAVSSTQINLAWAHSGTGVSEFKIERRLGQGAFLQIAVVPAAARALSDQGLQPQTTYSYRVRASNSAGDSPDSNVASAATQNPPLQPPTAPQGLQAAAVSPSQVNLTWTDTSANEDGFKIERKQGAQGAWAQIDSVAANQTTYASTGLTPQTLYSFRVRAYNTAGDSPYSNEASATTLALPPTDPCHPANVSEAMVYSGPQGVNARIFQPSCLGCHSSAPRVVFTTLPLLQQNRALIVSRLPNMPAPSGLPADLRRQVETFFRFDEEFQTSLPETLGQLQTYCRPPAAAADLRASTVTSSSIALAWSDNSPYESGFRIRRKQGAQGTYSQVGTVTRNTTTFTSGSLLPGTTYFFQVQAYSNASGAGELSGEIQVTTSQPPAPPAAPSELGASAQSQTRIDLSWRDNSADEDGFKIERRQGMGAWAQIAVVNPGVVVLRDEGLSPNTAYSYRVRAFNGVGDSPYSNEASATTQAPQPPAAPSLLTATVISATRIDLAWQDNSPDEEGFRVERRQGAGSWELAANVGPNVIRYENSGLTPETAYSFRVLAFNTTGGNSAFSNEASATTAALNPLDICHPTNRVAELAYSGSQGMRARVWQPYCYACHRSGNPDGRLEIDSLSRMQEHRIPILQRLPSMPFPNPNALPVDLRRQAEIFLSFDQGPEQFLPDTLADINEYCAPPRGARDLALGEITPTSIRLSYARDSRFETGIKIWRKQGVGGTYSLTATVGRGVLTHVSAGLLSQTTYFFKVQATSTVSGDGPMSAEVSGTTLNPPPQPPAPPSNLAATATTENRIELRWRDNSPNEDGFRVERLFGAEWREVGLVAANTVEFINTGLIPATRYSYRVKAYNGAGESAPAGPVEATTPSSNPFVSLRLVSGLELREEFGRRYDLVPDGLLGGSLLPLIGDPVNRLTFDDFRTVDHTDFSLAERGTTLTALALGLTWAESGAKLVEDFDRPTPLIFTEVQSDSNVAAPRVQAQLRKLHQLIIGRAPTSAELTELTRLFTGVLGDVGSGRAAWSAVIFSLGQSHEGSTR